MKQLGENLYIGRVNAKGDVRLMQFKRKQSQPPQAHMLYDKADLNLDILIDSSTWPAVVASVCKRQLTDALTQMCEHLHQDDMQVLTEEEVAEHAKEMEHVLKLCASAGYVRPPESVMKAKPVRNVIPYGYQQCSVEEATHITINIPGPQGLLTLPIQTSGTRAGTGNWTWNGDTESPTLMPSVLTTCEEYRCHTWITDGNAIFLDDCSHELKGETHALLNVPSDESIKEQQLAHVRV